MYSTGTTPVASAHNMFKLAYIPQNLMAEKVVCWRKHLFAEECIVWKSNNVLHCVFNALLYWAKQICLTMHANTLITFAIHLSRYNNDNDVIYGDGWTLLLLGTKEMGGNHNKIRFFSLSYREENL